MWAVTAAFGLLTALKQSVDLVVGERVAGFDRGFAGHHVEYVVDQRFGGDARGVLG